VGGPEDGGREAQALVDRDQPVELARPGAWNPPANGELGLERGQQGVPLGGQLGDRPPEEGARAGLPRLAVQPPGPARPSMLMACMPVTRPMPVAIRSASRARLQNAATARLPASEAIA
jgi:hypothetical protein